MNNTTNTPNVKRCSQGDNCIHPEGPILPRTREYFYFSSGRAASRCIECQKVYRREHHKKNREYDNARSREYAKKNGDRYALYRQNYYIRKAKAVGNGHTIDQLSEKYIEQDGCCYWCGVKVGLKFEIDHIIPISRGGIDAIENIAIACGECNRSKGDKLPEEWDDNPQDK